MSEKTPPKKRRFWQLHLSTAIILMLITGSFLGFNFQRRVSGLQYKSGTLREETGWPIKTSGVEIQYFVVAQSDFEGYFSGTVPRWFTKLFDEAHAGHFVEGLYERENGFRMTESLTELNLTLPPDCSRSYYWQGIALNVVSLIASNLIIAVICEYLIRRREGRKP